MNIQVYLDYQDDGGWHNISDAVQYDSLTINHTGFSTSYKYAQNTCDFDVIYMESIFSTLINTHSDILVRIIDLQDSSLVGTTDAFVTDPTNFFTCEDDGTATALFYGYIPNSKSWSYNGILNNTKVSIEATDLLDTLDVPAGELLFSDGKVCDPSDIENSILHYLLFKAGWGDARAYTSDFSTSVDGWVATGGDISYSGKSLILDNTATTGYITKTGFVFSGEGNPFMAFNIACTGNNPSEVRIYYSTNAHGFSESYYKSVSFSDNEGTWTNIIADMSDLTVGGTDWVDNDITGIKIEVVNVLSGGTTEYKNIVIGSVSNVSEDVTISTVIEKFVPDSEDTSILSLLDTLLYEYGYSLSCNAMGYITPIKWAVTDTESTTTFDDSNIVDSIDVKDSVLSYDGMKLTYYTVGVVDDILLYRDSNCTYNDDGTFEGYDVIEGTYYPPSANVLDDDTGVNTVVEQTYTEDGISYVTNKAIANNLDYNMDAFDSNFSGILATSGHYLQSSYAGLDLVVSSFGNKKCRLLYKNNTTEAIKLYYNNVFGKVWYKSEEITKEIDLVDIPVKLQSYISSFIFDATTANAFVKALVAQYDTGLQTYSFTSETQVAQGTLCNVTLDACVDVLALVRSVSYNEKSALYTYKCISCSANRAYTTNNTTSQIGTVNQESPYSLVVNSTNIVVPFDSLGVGDYSNAVVTANVYQNNVLRTGLWNITATPSSGIVGSLSGTEYTVTEITGLTGTIVFTATKGTLTLTNTVNVTVSGKGEKGDKGDAGISILAVTEYYAVSASNTTAPTSWSTSVQTMTATLKYLWNYEKITYSNGTTSSTDGAVIGTYGDTGNGISSVVNYYLATSSYSGVTTSSVGWTIAVQTTNETDKYLWNYEKVIYTDSTEVETEPCIIGNYATDGTNGSDSIIDITDPAETTPQTGMAYNNTYFGYYKAQLYKWTWDSGTTGYWTLTSATVPTDAVIHYSFDDLQDLPDVSGANTYQDNDFTAVPSGWSVNSGSPSSTFENGLWHVVADAPSEGYFKKITAGNILICNVIVKSGKLRVYTKTSGIIQSITSSDGWTKVEFLEPSATDYVLYTPTSANYYVAQLYIGDGTTVQPIIDNFSGSHNATASGIVSAQGMSGKCAHFLELKSSQFDLSAYTNVQSWWHSRWIYIDYTNITTNPRFWQYGNKDYCYTADGSSSGTGNVNILTYNGSTAILCCIPRASLVGGWHHLVVQTTIASSTSTTKKVYLDGSLFRSASSTADFTALAFTDQCFNGGLSLTGSVMNGYQDDFHFGVGEISDSDVLGLYLARGNTQKLYSLADSYTNQGVKKTDSPTFTDATISGATISSLIARIEALEA